MVTLAIWWILSVKRYQRNHNKYAIKCVIVDVFCPFSTHPTTMIVFLFSMKRITLLINYMHTILWLMKSIPLYVIQFTYFVTKLSTSVVVWPRPSSHLIRNPPAKQTYLRFLRSFWNSKVLFFKYVLAE